MKILSSKISAAVIILTLLAFSVPMAAKASSLTQTQIQAIVGLLQVFGADANSIANVQNILTGNIAASGDLKTSTADMPITAPTTGDQWSPGDNKSVLWTYPTALAGKYIQFRAALLTQAQSNNFSIYSANASGISLYQSDINVASLDGYHNLQASFPFQQYLNNAAPSLPSGQYVILLTAYDPSSGITHYGLSGVFSIIAPTPTPAFTLGSSCVVDLSMCSETQKAAAWKGRTSLQGTIENASYLSTTGLMCSVTNITQSWPVITEPGWWCGVVVSPNQNPSISFINMPSGTYNAGGPVPYSYSEAGFGPNDVIGIQAVPVPPSTNPVIAISSGVPSTTGIILNSGWQTAVTTPAGQYQMKIYQLNGSAQALSSQFTIQSCTTNGSMGTYACPSITVLSPNGGETWVQGQQKAITWTGNGLSNVSAFLVPANSAGNGVGSLGAIGAVASGNALYWDGKTVWSDINNANSAKSIPPGNYKVYLVGNVANAAGQAVNDMSDNYFSIVASAGCTETDSGLDYYRQGSTIGKNNWDGGFGYYTDYCTGNVLTEYWCFNGLVANTNYNCAKGCQYGACVQN